MSLPVSQLTYVSVPVTPGPELLAAILRTSRPRNRRQGITGVLVSRDDLFVQLLEGPRQAVSDTFARILADTRHAQVTLVAMQDADFRLFGKWEMRETALPGGLWSAADVAAGVPRQAPMEDFMALFHRLAATPG